MTFPAAIANASCLFISARVVYYLNHKIMRPLTDTKSKKITSGLPISGVFLDIRPIRLKISIFIQETVLHAIFLVANHSIKIHIFHAVEYIGFNVRVFFLQFSNQFFRLQAFG